MEFLNGMEVRKVYRIIFEYSVAHKLEMRQFKIDSEDFAQDIFHNILKRKKFEFDERKVTGGLRAFIYNLCKRHLIDQKRKVMAVSRRDVYLISSNEVISEEDDTLTIQDTFIADVDRMSLVLELIESVPNEQITPRIPYTWKQLMKALTDKGPAEVAEEFGVSASTIDRLTKEMNLRFISF